MFGKRSIEPASTIWLAVLRVFVAFCFASLHSTTVASAQENSDENPKSVNANLAPSEGVCYGRVTNGEGKKLDGVKLSLVQGVLYDLGNAFT
ncbi:MAG: hypothetical protein AAF394_08885, partial [Planctomycetota bacterium]